MHLFEVPSFSHCQIQTQGRIWLAAKTSQIKPPPGGPSFNSHWFEWRLNSHQFQDFHSSIKTAFYTILSFNPFPKPISPYGEQKQMWILDRWRCFGSGIGCRRSGCAKAPWIAIVAYAAVHTSARLVWGATLPWPATVLPPFDHTNVSQNLWSWYKWPRIFREHAFIPLFLQMHVLLKMCSLFYLPLLFFIVGLVAAGDLVVVVVVAALFLLCFLLFLLFFSFLLSTYFVLSSLLTLNQFASNCFAACQEH